MKKLLNNLWMIAVGGAVIATLIVYYVFGIGRDHQELIADSIITTNQIGNNTINNPPLPKPVLTYEVVGSLNQRIADNKYLTEYKATISSEFPILPTTGISHPSFCSVRNLGGGPAIRGGITTNEIKFEILCTTNSPIPKDQIVFSLVEKKN